MNQAILNNETLAAVAHHPAEGVEILDLTIDRSQAFPYEKRTARGCKKRFFGANLACINDAADPPIRSSPWR